MPLSKEVEKENDMPRILLMTTHKFNNDIINVFK